MYWQRMSGSGVHNTPGSSVIGLVEPSIIDYDQSGKLTD